MAVVTAKETQFELIPEGKYVFQVTDIESGSGQYGPTFMITCEIIAPKTVDDVETEGKTIRALTSQTLSGGDKPSRLWELVTAAFGRAIQIGEDVDTDDLVGRRFAGLVGHKASGDKTFANILSYKPLPANKQAPMPVGGGDFAVGPDVEDADPFSDQ